MEEKDKGLVVKLGWANNPEGFSSNIPFLDRCKYLENMGWGMLADKNNPNRFDETNFSFSVVLPDNRIINTKDIEEYIQRKKGHYSSTNQEDIDMHSVQIYYWGFIASHSH